MNAGDAGTTSPAADSPADQIRAEKLLQAADGLRYVEDLSFRRYGNTADDDRHAVDALLATGSDPNSPAALAIHEFWRPQFEFGVVIQDKTKKSGSGTNRKDDAGSHRDPFASILENNKPLAARLSLAFAEQEFNHIHEPGAPQNGEISFQDLIDYRNTHSMNPVATDFVDYLLNNNYGTTAPNPSRFNAIRNMDKHDGLDGTVATHPEAAYALPFAPNAEGITMSDLYAAQRFLSDQTSKLHDLKYPFPPTVGAIKLEDLASLEKAFPQVANGANSIDQFDLTRYINCKCNEPQPGLETVASQFSVLADYAGAKGGALTLAQIKQAEQKLQSAIKHDEQVTAQVQQQRKQLNDSLQPLF